jgi:hypothetical protein
MLTMKRDAILLTVCIVASSLNLGCVSRSFELPTEAQILPLPWYFPVAPKDKVDLLFVIDNSGSMEHEQRNLRQQFNSLIESLRVTSPDSPFAFPSLRIGVISTDLGAGRYGLPSCEKTGGDAGKLQNRARQQGCHAPAAGWIDYNHKTDTTNVAGCNKGIDCVKEAFSCIANLGMWLRVSARSGTPRTER